MLNLLFQHSNRLAQEVIRMMQKQIGVQVKAQYFSLLKASYDDLFCFTAQCNQNKTFEKPRIQGFE